MRLLNVLLPAGLVVATVSGAGTCIYYYYFKNKKPSSKPKLNEPKINFPQNIPTKPAPTIPFDIKFLSQEDKKTINQYFQRKISEESKNSTNRQKIPLQFLGLKNFKFAKIIKVMTIDGETQTKINNFKTQKNAFDFSFSDKSSSPEKMINFMNFKIVSKNDVSLMIDLSEFKENDIILIAYNVAPKTTIN